MTTVKETEQEFKTWVTQLESWFGREARMLPWRKEDNPYFFLVSEFMLQQTTMEVVLPYFRRWIERFPSIDILAHSDIDEVRSYWAGLGYPRRAENLLKAAQSILENGYPSDYQGWLRLPGVGPYTAAILSSLISGQRKGVVDGNVIRVASRFLAEPFEHWKVLERERIQNWVDAAIQLSQDPGNFNQALMELGALICLKATPKCERCPIQKYCRGYQQAKVLDLPLKKERPPTEHWLVTFFVIQDQQKYLVIKNPQSAPFLKGIWTLPMRWARLDQGRVPRGQYQFEHRITRYRIFGRVQGVSHLKDISEWTVSDHMWVSSGELMRVSPYSILKKVLQSYTFPEQS